MKKVIMNNKEIVNLSEVSEEKIYMAMSQEGTDQEIEILRKIVVENKNRRDVLTGWIWMSLLSDINFHSSVESRHNSTVIPFKYMKDAISNRVGQRNITVYEFDSAKDVINSKLWNITDPLK